jgi:WD40 repeat protein
VIGQSLSHLRLVVGISHDNHWLVTGSDDNTARLWDLRAQDHAAISVVLRGHEGAGLVRWGSARITGGW